MRANERAEKIIKKKKAREMGFIVISFLYDR
jgi:hypothetical protein